MATKRVKVSRIENFDVEDYEGIASQGITSTKPAKAQDAISLAEIIHSPKVELFTEENRRCRNCGTWLNHYNHGDTCHSCPQKRRKRWLSQ